MSRLVRAAGALVWREGAAGLEVLLVHRPRYDDWSWPKGKLDRGESFPVAAVREVAEETGVQVALGAPLPGTRYRLGTRRRKEVRYWAARELAPSSPALAARRRVVHGDEVDELRWAAPQEAEAMLSRRGDRAPLRALVALHETGRLDTRPLVVVRHATAVPRAHWTGAESERPLTPEGRRQARQLVPHLAAYGVADVVSSPWERCLATVRPFTKRAGIAPRGAEELSEEAHSADPAKAARLLAEALETHVPVAVCTHRPVLATLLPALAAACPEQLRGRLPAEDPFLRPAGTVVAHLAAGAVVALEVRGGKD